MATSVPVVLITANVGSIFEEPSVMLKIWTEEFLSTISRLDPKFIALHCQEVGGKNYEQSMRHVEDFVRLLMSSEELRLFDKVRVFLDEDYSSAEHFTALGNFYFVHDSIKDVLLWDFKECTFVPVTGKEVHSGNIETVTTKEKAKFPQEFFPECKWSRKGFLRTRWNMSGTVFDLINIHLFHDASNFIAMETFPSVYSKTRRRALEHTLDMFHNDQYQNAPYFLFGDFNFRTDTASVIKKLTEDTRESKLSNKGSISKLQFRNEDDKLILSLGKKEFSYHEHQNVFIEDSGTWLREYDKELEDFEGRLFEFPIKFLPSYPFEEDIKEGTNYMQTRVPAWCDRVLLSPAAKTLVLDASAPNGALEYGIIGPTTCMGDHKPVFLRVSLASDAGMLYCCASPNAPDLCFQVPDDYMELLSMLPDCHSCANARALSIDNSSNLLHAVPIKHDPYTPDSMDSPSPNTLVAAENSDPENANGAAEFASLLNHRQLPPKSMRHVDRAVSPALLKSRLELIVQEAAIRRSPSEYHLYTCSDSERSQLGLRKDRSNSDASWQRSQLLQDRAQACRSISDFLRSSGSNGDVTERVIPRIAIINASNFESDASSVHLQEFSCLEQRFNAKAIGGDVFCLAKSEEFFNKIDEESERQSSSADEKCENFRSDVLGTASRNSTRSCESIRSQETKEEVGAVNLKAMAYNKVTERYKKNIVGKKSRCRKCCCALS